MPRAIPSSIQSPAPLFAMPDCTVIKLTASSLAAFRRDILLVVRTTNSRKALAQTTLSVYHHVIQQVVSSSRLIPLAHDISLRQRSFRSAWSGRP
jgi:hypothetical protein